MARRRIIVIVNLFVFALASALASPLKAGLRVKTHDDDATDPVCRTKEDLRRYQAANDGCAFGSPGDCKFFKTLEDQRICGLHYKTYIVVSVVEENNPGLPRQTGWVQLSPVGHESERYWGDVADFDVVLMPRQKVRSIIRPDPVCVTKAVVQSYVSARDACWGKDSSADCASFKKFEEQKSCGFQYGTYIVVSVEEQSGLMQLSPVGREAELYWAKTADFDLAP
jgi:hypothetical protein